MLGSGRTVLVLSDDAATVYTVLAGRYDLAGDVRWQDAEFIPHLAELLRRQGKSRPVLVLYDMVEQYYRKEIVPKVAVFDQQNVLKRRLASAFPNYTIRASLALAGAKGSKGSKGNAKTQAGLPGKGYLFTALPETDQMVRVTESVREAMVSSPGIFLLPIESVSMVEQLSARVNQGKPIEDRWTVFMSQHRGGGLRQIVVRNGELALTRLSPVIDTDIEPHLWAAEVTQEFNATMGYLSRFGYTQDSELEVIAVGGAKGIAELEEQLKAPIFHGLEVADAARLLKLNVRTDEALRYGDILHVGWLAKKVSFTLPMLSRELDLISKGRQAGLLAAGISTVLMLGSVAYTGYQGYALNQADQDLQVKRQRLVQLENEYQAELKRKEEFNIDVKLVQGSIGIYDRLEKGRVDIIDVLRQVALSMTDDLRFDNIQMRYEVEQTSNPDPMSVQMGERKVFTADLVLSFPDSMKPEIGNKVVSDLRDRMAQRLQDYTVSVTQSVKDLTMNASYDYEAGVNADLYGSSADRVSMARISIRQKQNDQTPGP